MDKNPSEYAAGGRGLTPEQAELLRKARKAGFDLTGSTPAVSSERIIQAANSPAAVTIRVTDMTTDEELSAFIHGKERGRHE